MYNADGNVIIMMMLLLFMMIKMIVLMMTVMLLMMMMTMMRLMLMATMSTNIVTVMALMTPGETLVVMRVGLGEAIEVKMPMQTIVMTIQVSNVSESMEYDHEDDEGHADGDDGID